MRALVPRQSLPQGRHWRARQHRATVCGGRGAGNNDRPAKWDARLFGVGAQILRALKVGKMRLLSNPRKIPSMAGFGLEITGFVDKG